MALVEHHLREFRLVTGLDEAGRGCLAGPVVAAAVILPYGFSDSVLNDSKKMTVVQRNSLRWKIERVAVCYAVAFVFPRRIDEVNILWASIEAMHFAIDSMTVIPEHLLIDGNRFSPYKNIPHECVIKGDGKFQSIAAASVLAKTYRDAYMEELHYQFPSYGWNHNKGYPTRMHREGIVAVGSCSQHRNSFKLLGVDQMEKL